MPVPANKILDQDDPFLLSSDGKPKVKSTEKQQPAKVASDPFLLGSPKKKDGTEDVSIPAPTGSSEITPLKPVSTTENEILPPKQGLFSSIAGVLSGHPLEQQPTSEQKYTSELLNVPIDENDPVGSILTPLDTRKHEIFNKNLASESTNQNRVLTGKADSDEVDLINQVQSQIKKDIFPTIGTAKLWLQRHPEVTTDNNRTAKIANDIVIDDVKASRSLSNNGGDIVKAAVEYASLNDDDTGEKLRIMKRDNTPVPRELEGVLVHKFLNNPTVQELKQQSPEFLSSYRNQANQFYKNYPELHNQAILSAISQGREDYNYNNWFLNLPGANSSDKVVDRLVKDGKLSEEDKDFYNKVTRPLISIGAADIKTPGLVETGVQSIGNTTIGTIKGLADITGARELLRSKGDIIAQDLQEDFSQTKEPEYNGLLHKISHATGNLAGVVLPIGGEAKLLKAANIVRDATLANEIATGLTFYHDIQKKETENNPDNPLLAHLSALIQSAIWAKGGQALPGLSKGFIQDNAPEVRDVLKRLQSGEITNSQAAGNIVNTFIKTGKETLSTSAKITGTAALNDAVSGVLSGKYDLDHSVKNAANTFESMLLGSPLLSLKKVMAENSVLPDMIDEIANYPDYFRDQIGKLAEKDPEFAKRSPEILQNLEYLTAIKKVLNGRDDIPDYAKKRYQLLSLQERVLENKANAIPDKNLQKPIKDELKGIEEQKDEIINPKLTELSKKEKKVIQELKDNKDLATQDFATQGRQLYEAAQNPELHTEAIKMLIDQSNDMEGLKASVGEGVANAVSELGQKSEIKSPQEQLTQQPEVSGIEKDKIGLSISAMKADKIIDLSNLVDEYPDDSLHDFSIPGNKEEVSKQISQAYIDAKKNGDNPELVKAVEDALIPQSEINQQVSGIEEKKPESKFPKPQVPIQEMNSEQLYEHAKTVRDYNKNIEKEFFGEDGAKKYKEAQRIFYSINASSDEKKAADKVINEMEGALTEGQRNEFFGIGFDESGIYDHYEISDLAGKVRLIEEAENVNDIARSLKLPLLEFSRNKNPSTESLTLLNAAKSKAIELGIHVEDLIKESVNNIAKDLKDKNDGAFLAKTVIDKLMQPTESQKSLPSKPEQNSEPIQPVIESVESIPEKELPPEIKKEAEKIPESEPESQVGEVPPIATELDKQVKDDNEGTGITHAETTETRKEFGLPEYEKKTKEDTELEAQADELIKKGFNVGNLLNKIETEDYTPSDVEYTAMKKYKPLLEDQVSKDPSDENLRFLQRFVKATDMAGTREGRSFRARKGLNIKDDSLAGFFVREMDINNDAPLTEGQKRVVEKEHSEISEAEKAYQQKIAGLEEENRRLKAEKNYTGTKSTTKKGKKTTEDFTTERKSLREKLSEAHKEHQEYLKSLHIHTQGFGSFTFKEAKIVGELVKSYAEEGIQKLSDVVNKVFDEIKGTFPNATKQDIYDVISGEYADKKAPRNELTAKLFDFKTEAQLLNKLDDLLNGVQPSSSRRQIKRNQEIESLRAQIKEVQKRISEQNKTPLTQEEIDKKSLASYKKRAQKSIDDLQEQLRTGKFEPVEKKELKLDSEAKELRNKVISLRTDREIRVMKQQYQNRNAYQKTNDWIIDKLNIPRTLMASMDYSAPLRQGIVAGISHPRTAALAGIEMFKSSFSKQHFDNWLYEMREDPRFETMQKSELAVTDPHSPFLAAKEEAFMNNTAEKIPLIGKTLRHGNVTIPGLDLIARSERAYVMFLNKMRVDLFNRFADRFEEKGRTFENSPKLYKAMAALINSETGRGSLGALNNAAPLLNALFFSPRLIASRINLLTNWANSKWYKNTPKEIRVMYMKDMLKFIGTGMAVLSLIKYGLNSNVEDDPRSTDFGKIKQGNTRWDIWGGFQQYIRFVTQMALGEKKSTNTGQIQQLNGKGMFGETRFDAMVRFGRGKLAPVPSMFADVMAGRDAAGDQVTLSKELQTHLTPLLYQDVRDAMKDKGIQAIFTVGIPSAFGVGTSTYQQKPSKKKQVTKQLY